MPEWSDVGEAIEELRPSSARPESYVTDRWTRQVVNIVEFDNLAIAREYVGPAQSPATGARR